MSNTDTDPTQLGDSPEFLRRMQSNPLSVPQPQSPPDPTQWGDSPEFLERMRQPRALPPAIGNFLGNIGAFVPGGTSPPPPQGMPPPQWPPPFRENRRQMYVPSQANRPVTDLGKPPTFPQMPDMWQVPGIYEGVGRQLGRWGGSQRTRLMAGNLSRFTNAYMQGSQRGQREYSRIQHQRMTEAADALQGMLESDLQNYGTAYNSYGGDPQRLQSDLMNRATQLGDTEMQAALNLGPREAERLLQWRQAKYDDLSRSNTARREHDEALRISNPFYVNPVGVDGTPTARLPADKLPAMRPLGTPTGVQLAALTDQGTPEWQPEDKERDVTHPPETTNDPRYEPSWMTGRDPNLTIENLDRPQNGAPESHRDDRVQLAQADTGTATDAPTLPQITVKPSEEDQAEEGQDGRTVWDDVRLRSQLRELRGQGGTSGGPRDQPPSATGAQPPQPPAAGQPQGAAGSRRPGQPAGATAQAPDQTVPPQAGTPAQTAPPAAAGDEGLNLPPVRMTPTLRAAQAQGIDPRMIDTYAQRRAFGQLTATELRKFKEPIFNAIEARSAEVQAQIQGISTDPNIRDGDRDAVFAAARNISPYMESQVRGFTDGTLLPDKNTPPWMYQLIHKADPSITQQTFLTRGPTLKLHTTGKMAENRMKLGTAVGHGYDLLNELRELEKPGPGGISVWDLWKAKQLGRLSPSLEFKFMPETSAKIGALTRAINTFDGEYNNVMRYTGPGSVMERREMKLELDPQNPAKSIADVEKALDEMKVRLGELNNNFEVGYGGSYDRIKKNYDPSSIPGATEEDKSRSAEGLNRLERRQSGNRGRLPPGVTIEEVP